MDMKKTLVANIGQRDLNIDVSQVSPEHREMAEGLVGLIKQKPPEVRFFGRKVLDAYETLGKALVAPILDPVLASFAARGERLSELVLVGTKQEDKKFLGGDTFTCGEVLRRMLPERHAAVMDGALVRVHIVEGPPMDLNAMLPCYGKLCDGIAADRVYAECTGGTPACNMALVLKGLEHFGERLEILHMPEGAIAPTRLNVVGYLLRRLRRTALERLTARGDFDAVADDPAYPDSVRHLAGAAAARMNFDFKMSLHLLNKAPEGGKGCREEQRARVQELRQQARELAGSVQEAVRRELYWNARLKWRRGECADFLGRAWRLLEDSLYELLEPVVGGKGKENFKVRFDRWINQQPEEMKKYIRSRLEKKPNATDMPLTANIPTMILTIKYLLTDTPQRLRLDRHDETFREKLDNAINNMRKLTELRNKSVIAHGFEGLSREVILQNAGALKTEEDLLQCLATLLAVRGGAPGEDPYAVYAAAVLAAEEEA